MPDVGDRHKTTKMINVTVKFLSMIFITAIALSGCSKDNDNPDDPTNAVPDPAGTITANISESTGISIDNKYAGNIFWISPDNFYLSGSYGSSVSICDLGQMSGLGNITNIPQTGYTIPSSWNEAVACESKHGYVLKFEYPANNELTLAKYVRLYVVEPIISTSDGIMGAKVKYQYPFNAATLNAYADVTSLPRGDNISFFVTVNTDDPQWTGGVSGVSSGNYTIVRETNGLRITLGKYLGGWVTVWISARNNFAIVQLN